MQRFAENIHYFGANEQVSLENEVNEEMSSITFISKLIDRHLLPKKAKEAL